MTNRELIDILSRLDPDAEILIVDFEFTEYREKPMGVYGSFAERVENEGQFEIKSRDLFGKQIIEIGGIDAFV